MVSYITTHVLDGTAGGPAKGVKVTLEAFQGNTTTLVAQGVTDDDGRITDLGPEVLEGGRYVITFDVEGYFQDRNIETFYPVAVVHFQTKKEEDHYHVPLILSPFSYGTYRGS